MKNQFEKTIGRQVAKLRKEKTAYQAQLAEVLDVAPEIISRLERGISMPSLKTFEREIARIVNLLKTRNVEEIKVGHLILKNVFQCLRNYSIDSSVTSLT